MTTRALSKQQMPEQLKMFMSPREILAETAPGDLDTNYVPGTTQYEAAAGEMWHSKRERVKHSGLDESIRSEGVQEPVRITHGWEHPMLTEGHHRTIAEFDIDPDRLMPVSHWEAGYR